MEQLAQKNIVFCFPYRGVGGVSLLFLRMSNYLQKISNNKIYLVDYKDGYMARHNRNKQIFLLEYSDDIKTEIPTNSVVILQSMTPWSLFPQLNFKYDTNLFFWNCHPFNLVPLLPGFRNLIAQYPKLIWLIHKTILLPYNIQLKKFYSFLVKTHSIAFMDIDNLKMTEYILESYSTDNSFLPIPIEVPQSNYWIQKTPSLTKDKPLNCSWIGRVADFKYTVLKRTIIELKRFAKEQKISIHFFLIGDGEYISEIQSELIKTEFFSFEWIKEVQPHQLDQFILTNIDILFSMGTSALEAAKLGVPTVLLDFSYGPVNEEYAYKYIYETKSYSLGRIITSEICKEKKSIDKIILDAMSRENKISEKCYNYTLENHHIEKITKDLLNKIDKSELTYDSLIKKGFLKKNFIYRSFKHIKKSYSNIKINK